MHNTPAAASPKPFDLTSTAFLIVAFLTGIAGALQTPTLSLFLTNEVHARPAMVGFFFTGSAIIGILVSQFFWPGVPTEKAIAKSLIVFCCLLGVFACVLFTEPQLFHSAVCWGVPEQLRLDRQPADVRPCPRACRPHRAEAVMFSSILRAGVACVGDWPPLAYAGNGFWLYGNVPQRGGSLRGVWRNGMVLPAFHA